MKARLGLAHFDVGLIVVPLQAMARINLRHRRKRKPTDVLSFATHGRLVPGQQLPGPAGLEPDMGDIVLCPEYIRFQAGLNELRFRQFTVAALAHGLCHLAGYTHYTQATAREMLAVEQDLIDHCKDRLMAGNSWVPARWRRNGKGGGKNGGRSVQVPALTAHAIKDGESAAGSHAAPATAATTTTDAKNKMPTAWTRGRRRSLRLMAAEILNDVDK